jgi:predicted  nucleic acid-binding Zn-ribbon protein
MKADGLKSDGSLVAEIAGLDGLQRERDAAWRVLVRRLDALRREVAMAEVREIRARAAPAAPGDEGDDSRRRTGPGPEEARVSRLTREFEAALKETEARRIAFHKETSDLRRRRDAALARLSAPLARAYRSLLDAGCDPAIVAVTEGACGVCQSSPPSSDTEALRQGAVAVCAVCERLLYLPRDGR